MNDGEFINYKNLIFNNEDSIETTILTSNSIITKENQKDNTTWYSGTQQKLPIFNLEKTHSSEYRQFSRTAWENNAYSHIKISCCMQKKMLTGLRNYDDNLFLCPPQNRRNHNQYIKLLFLKINLHFGTTNLRSTYEKLNSIPLKSIYLVFSPLLINRSHYRPKYSTNF